MARLIWSEDALRDLSAIAEYIAQDSPEEGRQFVQKVFQKADKLLDFPRTNRKVPEKDLDQLREILFKNYPLTRPPVTGPIIVEILLMRPTGLHNSGLDCKKGIKKRDWTSSARRGRLGFHAPRW